ncbi:RICIN domain-containing protein [Streptomyces sp. CBMA152]|uniref:RICIN domain-containing protein n=1 Tax=Streptomyces sp. CBMA152 TaxID=1896312 RepID=UPI0016603680|nr:RICIN domain-containing protein [Streptomyces sp. CBMA152]
MAARIILLLTAVAMVVGLAVRPDLAGSSGRGGMSLVGDSYDGYDTKASEQLRGDQCVAADALRRGGASLFALAQDAIGLPPDQLHQKVYRDLLNDKTPLHQARNADSDSTDQWLKKVSDQEQVWSGATSGLDFPHPPRGDGKVFDQVGLLPWLYQSYGAGDDVVNPFYDPSPTADDKTKAAALAIGDALYTTAGTPQEQQAWALWKKNSGKVEENQWFVPRVFTDDARIFLSSGGFPTTAPAPDSPEFRIAVEDLKARFATCAWHDPIDPNRALGKEVAQASAEWQQEIASQAAQRQQILGASSTAAKALQDGTFALGKLVGQSWVADYSTRWLDYSTEGGVGWIGDAPNVIKVVTAAGKCLDVEGGSKDNGASVQIWNCNNGAAQDWRLEPDGSGLHLRNPSSGKCLDVDHANSADGTKIQIWNCNQAPAQTWEADVRATTSLRNTGTGKCLDLRTFTNGQDAFLYPCNGTDGQKFKVSPKGHTGPAPTKANVDKAKANITGAQVEAKKQLDVLRAQLETAKKAAATSTTAQQAAYTIADQNGAPRGRGLIVGQQKDQVTQGAVAALEAMVKAGETAEAATRASAADSDTITQRALAQAAQVRAEFRKKAAETAELQAQAARDAAKMHRDNAKTDAESAKAKLADAVKAEGEAKAAAAQAHAKRLAAEAQEQTAKAEKETAAAKQAEANQHKQNAQAEAGKAKDAKDKAEAAEQTAKSNRDDAVKARDKAQALRDDVYNAEQKADAARAKADSKEAYAQSLDAGDAADAARKAANEAAAAADDAKAAAKRARTEADAATQAAADADAAATRAEAAAKRARSDADAAQAAKLKADAAVRTATSAAADAIQASKDAAAEATAAVKQADLATAQAKTAKSNADAAGKEALTALAAAAKAAGYAHVTAQAAADATAAARQVAKPANDAVQLGSPYADTDSTASLVVLTGQASKTVAEQQQAVAQAHADNAKTEAEAAKDIANQAQGDTKEAYLHAANAAGYAAEARGYAKEALGYSTQAAGYAAEAAKSLARTVEYDRQATEDAAAADKAAGRAEGYAKEARESADQAALDAAAARDAADQAAQAAKDAQAAADRANTAATEAEQAAKDAAKAAKDAQDAAQRAETKEKNTQISTGAGSIGGVFFKTKLEPVGEPENVKKDNCNVIIHTGDCIITATITSKVFVDLFLCTNPDIPDAQSGCLASDTLFLASQELKPQTQEVTYTITQQEFNHAIGKGLIKALTEDFTGCWDKITGGGGSLGNCGWAAFDITSLVFGNVAIKAIADGVKAVDAAARTGIGFIDAWRGLRTVGLTEEAIAGIGAKLLRTLGDTCGRPVARTALTTVHAAAAAKGCWVVKGGPGVWAITTEGGKSARAVAYEFQITGVPEGFGYKILNTSNRAGELKFDGFNGVELLEAKGPGYSQIMKFRPDIVKTDFVAQAEKQVAAAPNTSITWHIAESDVFDEAEKVFAANEKLARIKVVYTPPAP